MDDWTFIHKLTYFRFDPNFSERGLASSFSLSLSILSSVGWRLPFGIMRPSYLIPKLVPAVRMGCTETRFHAAVWPDFGSGFQDRLAGREIGVGVALRAVGVYRAQFVGGSPR